MTYQITASPATGKTVTKKVEGVRELQATLAQYRERGYEITHISRPRKVLHLIRKVVRGVGNE